MEELTWALVIATYKRAHVLTRCLRLAAEQTRPPDEIIVVDASPDWAETRDLVMHSIASQHPGIRWEYVAAEERSSATQRNQGVGMANADVVFLIDDDSLMYPDCAEQIMKVYEADPANAVAGVSSALVEEPPDSRATEAIGCPSRGLVPRQQRNWLARLVRRPLRADDIFVPYDQEFPVRSIPDSLSHLDIRQTRLMHGARMTFRREMALREPFDEIMERYASGEDSDTSYRISRHGMLLKAFKARLCHLQASNGRLSEFVVTALGAMNAAVLHRIYGVDYKRSYQLTKRLLRRRFVIQFLKDLSKRRLSLPHARGIWYAYRHLDDIFQRNEDELRRWYPQFQRRMIEADPRENRLSHS